MTIDDKIAKLKLEIDVAEKALKEKVTDVADIDYAHLVQNFGSNLLSPAKDKLSTNSLSSLLPAQLNNKYGYLINVIQRVIRLMR